jgi:transposase
MLCWLADLLRMGSLPESWIAPLDVRELRELVRYRHKLSQLRTGLKSQVHAVLGKEGVIPALSGLWGPAGAVFLDELGLGDPYQWKVDSIRDLIDHYNSEIGRMDPLIHDRLRDHPGYRAIQQLAGVGLGLRSSVCR